MLVVLGADLAQDRREALQEGHDGVGVDGVAASEILDQHDGPVLVGEGDAPVGVLGGVGAGLILDPPLPDGVDERDGDTAYDQAAIVAPAGKPKRRRTKAADVDAAVAAHAQEPPPSPLMAQRDWIDSCYDGDTVADIVAALRANPSVDAVDRVRG